MVTNSNKSITITLKGNSFRNSLPVNIGEIVYAGENMKEAIFTKIGIKSNNVAARMIKKKFKPHFKIGTIEESNSSVTATMGNLNKFI